MYMLPTYTGDIANLDAERLTEDDLEDILNEDDINSIKTATIELNNQSWFIGVEIYEEGKVCRISFSRMEEAKGSFNESVIVSNIIFGIEPIMQKKKDAIESLKEQISIQKKVLSSFGETKTETITLDSLY